MKTLAQPRSSNMHESLKQVLQGKISLLLLLLHQIHPRVSSQNPNLNSPRDETLTLDFKMLQEDQETLVTPRERERETKYK
jgi:hypothetical protein